MFPCDVLKMQSCGAKAGSFDHNNLIENIMVQSNKCRILWADVLTGMQNTAEVPRMIPVLKAWGVNGV